MDITTKNQLGISDAMAEKLAKLHIDDLWDLVLHLPLRYEDETHVTPIADAMVGQSCLIEATVRMQEVQFKPRRQLVVQVEDAAGHVLYLRFIHFYPNQQKQLAEGNQIRALGEVRHGFFGDEMVHPKIRLANEQSLNETLTPIYSTVAKLPQNTLRRLIQQALDMVDLCDTLPEKLRQQLALPTFDASVRLLHYPTPDYTQNQLQDGALPAWQRLKFDELLAQQLSMNLARDARHGEYAQPLVGDGHLCQALRAQLPFALTDAQERVLQEIAHDLAQPHPMHRLLQGDVGSGKTVVAALSALLAIEAGFQAAIMAPTEILAEQHFQRLSTWFADMDIAVVWLSGSLKKKEKEKAKQAIASHQAALAIGTHALFQDDVDFAKLGLVVVDEQHRFGVAQRLALKSKGNSVHQLMMSATPIPRSLAMSFMADLDVSVIDSLPPGRVPIETKLVNAHRRAEVERFVLHTVNQGQQVYWVCPLIEESETLQLQTAVETQQTLDAVFPNLQVGLLHGRMKSAEKAEVMDAFATGNIEILVATTVIEVGVDVPNAALMVIEHAERMGLSQLHQLRGRVGRGSSKSVCVLMFSEPLGDIAKARLKVIFEHTDGFEIARQDLHLRGPGEFLGARQSGVPLLRFANLEDDLPLLEAARNIAPKLMIEHPDAVQAHLARWLGNKKSYLGV